jgi:hypothetical protein
LGIELPGSVRWVAEKVVGDEWPEGDETAMRRLADEWQSSGKIVHELVEDAQAALRRSLGSIEGATAQQLTRTWIHIECDLNTLVAQCESHSGKLEECATKIEHAKLSIIGALVALAAEIAASVAATPLTLGLSGLAAPAAEAATVITIRMIIRRLIFEIMDAVLVSGITDSTVEAFAQGVQVAKGDRDGWDYRQLAGKGSDGAISGLVGGVAGRVGDDLAAGMASAATQKLTTSAADAIGEGLADVTTAAMPWNSEDGGPTLDGARDAMATEFLKGLAGRERR